MFWIIRLTIVIIAIGYFQAGLRSGRLAVMPGSRLNEHGHLVVLLLFPWPEYLPLQIIVALIYLCGTICYADDYYQHHMRTLPGQENYRSPLHLWGWYTVGEPLKRWLSRHTWKGFDDVG